MARLLKAEVSKVSKYRRPTFPEFRQYSRATQIAEAKTITARVRIDPHTNKAKVRTRVKARTKDKASRGQSP